MENSLAPESWEPLPQRKKKRSQGGSLTNSMANDEIDSNIKTRSERIILSGTLEGLDGCKAEFYEYLDHTADVQLHAWGTTLKHAFENIAPCMFNYITDLSKVESNPEQTIIITVTGHDMDTLLFNYLDELLYHFSTDGFVCVSIQIDTFHHDISTESFKIVCTAYGEKYDPTKHTPGTEVKAITYSNMQIHETEIRADLYVIVDI